MTGYTLLPGRAGGLQETAQVLIRYVLHHDGLRLDMRNVREVPVDKKYTF